MKILRIPDGSKIFLDTAPLIYWAEGHPDYAPLLEPIFLSISQKQQLVISSGITLLEVLVKPLRTNRQDLISRYKDLLLHHVNFELVTVEHSVCEAAAFLRAKYPRIKALDAIQLAIAQSRSVDVFLTNDNRLKQVQEVPVIVLDDYVKRK